MPSTRISEIVAGRRSITADTDLRRCRFFGLSEGYWLRAQVVYDIEVARERLAGELDKIHPWIAALEAARCQRSRPTPQLAPGRPLFGVALDRFVERVELAEMGLRRGAFEDLRDRGAGSVNRLPRPRSLIDTSVLSETIRQKQGAAVVEKLRMHGGEPATTSVVWHALTYRVRLPKLSRKRCAIERYHAEVVTASLPILPYDVAAAGATGPGRAA